MQAILDTNSFLWFISGSEKLSINALEFIADSNNRLVMSTAGLWEIAIKVSINKLNLLQPYEKLIPQQLKENDINVMPIELSHLAKVIELPFYHRDPFDRIIIAQALIENLPIVTSDSIFSQYSVKLIW
ncbi:MAG: type II toxin-antitoxin system VapC family toxin [Pseudomonadota bacterium]